LGIIFPIAGFVAMGFEHCIANMFFIPYGLLAQLEVNSNYTFINMMSSNILPVSFGNVIGGVLFVGLPYWFIASKE
jgi:formate/nitrite transporter FocA (FNT family)